MCTSYRHGGTVVKIVVERLVAFCPQDVEVCRQVLPLALLQPCRIIIISEANFLKVLSMLKESVLVVLCIKYHAYWSWPLLIKAVCT